MKNSPGVVFVATGFGLSLHRPRAAGGADRRLDYVVSGWYGAAPVRHDCPGHLPRHHRALDAAVRYADDVGAVYRPIDGRKEIWGHGPRDMPIWGTVFTQEAGPDFGAELQACARMREIVYSIESLQAPARRSR